eukprot:SAG11_NODE_1011_length_6195_cov_4.901247_2_plen_92_part_00
MYLPVSYPSYQIYTTICCQPYSRARLRVIGALTGEIDSLFACTLGMPCLTVEARQLRHMKTSTAIATTSTVFHQIFSIVSPSNLVLLISDP